MASFNEHITRAKQNLAFLIQINSQPTHSWDWEVTVCFYAAVHLVDAHLAMTPDVHPTSHKERKHLISPSSAGVHQLPTQIYLRYRKLEGLSKRARYMCDEDPSKLDNSPHPTYDKHLGRAIKILDELLEYFGNLYSISFTQVPIKCPDLPQTTRLKAFVLVA